MNDVHYTERTHVRAQILQDMEACDGLCGDCAGVDLCNQARVCQECGERWEDAWDCCTNPECRTGQESIQEIIADQAYHEGRGQ